MKNLFLLIFICGISSNLFSQNSIFTIEASYPLPVGDNFLGKNYKGVIDVGATYTFYELRSIEVGVAINFGVVNYNSRTFFDGFDLSNASLKVTSYIFKPKIFVQFHVESLQKMHPFLGLGYTYMKFDTSGVEIDTLLVSDESSGGINLNLGLAYDISDTIFIQMQYDFIKLNVDGDVPDTRFNTNVNIVKLGLGIYL